MSQSLNKRNAMESSLVLTSSASSTNDSYALPIPTMNRACSFPLKEDVDDARVQSTEKTKPSSSRKSSLGHKKSKEKRKKPHKQRKDIDPESKHSGKHKKKSQKKSARNKEVHLFKQRLAREKRKGNSIHTFSLNDIPPPEIKNTHKTPGQVSPVRAMAENPRAQTTKLFNHLKTRAQKHPLSPRSLSRAAKEKEEDLSEDMIPRQVLRVSSEESLEQDMLENDYTMTPKDIKKRAQYVMERDSLSSSSCSSEEEEEEEEEEKVIHRDDKGVLVLENETFSTVAKHRTMSRKEIQEAKLLWLLVGDDVQGVKKHHHRVQMDRDKIRRGDAARGDWTQQQKSKSMDRFSSGFVKTLRAVNEDSDSSSSQRREVFATGMTMSKSEPWDLRKFPGDRDRVCLSPRETNTLMSKDMPERRLCHRILFSTKGSLFTDEIGKDVYKDIVGMLVPDNDVMVVGATLCTFTGNRCTFRDIKDCQVLGNYCKIEGRRNFIRGRACVVSGDGNVIHVDEVYPKNMIEQSL